MLDYYIIFLRISLYFFSFKITQTHTQYNIKRIMMEKMEWDIDHACLFGSNVVKAHEKTGTYGAFSFSESFLDSDLSKATLSSTKFLTFETLLGGKRLTVEDLKSLCKPFNQWTVADTNFLRDRDMDLYKKVLQGMWGQLQYGFVILHPGYEKITSSGDFSVKYYLLCFCLQTTHLI